MSLSPNQTFSHYRIVEKIGEGGMGTVYLAEDTELNREVALKVLPSEVANHPERLRRFKQEARAIAALNHPNIVTVYSVEESDGLNFITMELVRGRRLTELLSKDGLPLLRLLDLTVSFANAVAAAHQRRIVHRDLKPDNVMVNEEGHIKVLDFGLAKVDGDLVGGSGTVAETATAMGTVLGTVAYMSPEQAQCKPVDPRSDVFSLGIIMYEMATGRRPFLGDSNVSILTSILRDAPRPITDSQSELPPALDEIVQRCLCKDPAQRYAEARALATDLEKLRAKLASDAAGPSVAAATPRQKIYRRLWVAGLLVLVTLVIWNWRRNSMIQWARTEAVPRIEQLSEKVGTPEWSRYAQEAHELATEAARYLDDDRALQRAWDLVARDVVVNSTPSGVDVWIKPYVSPDGEWRYIGRTPLSPVRFPRGLFRIKLSLDGYRTEYDLSLGKELKFTLHPEGSLPEEMVFVRGERTKPFLPGIDHLNPEPTQDFLMDRHEVTNAEYKQFLEAGGYEKPEYWVTPFIKDGHELSWKDAMTLFRDSTGRVGPATWEVGDFPDGLDNHPVGGVSWYEAAAYARWAKKSLPTVFHWNQVAMTSLSNNIVPLANFNGTGSAPVSHPSSLHRYGVFDLAGNVREWVKNTVTPSENRFILGGAWNDRGYSFTDGYAHTPWGRSPTNGFRCIRYLKSGEETEALTRPIVMPFRDFYNEEPASTDTFTNWMSQYEYDRTPLEASIDAEEEHEEWVRQTISFKAAYGSERMSALLFIPKAGKKPFRTVVYFPGSDVVHSTSSADVTGDSFDFLMKSSMAVMFPVYKSTFERGDELKSIYPTKTFFYKEHMIMWAKDLSRSIDYLETRRQDLDISNLAFYGISWGGFLGGILPAIENRIKVNILYVAGFARQQALPEVDQINYVSRVRQPTLMVNGEFDFFFPVDTSQEPFFDLLGTRNEDKRHAVYPGSHWVPRTELIKEVLAWLDKY